MRDRREAAIAYARRVLAASQGETAVEKTIWGSPAGKKRLSERLAAMLPAHKTYVEPFAGSASAKRRGGKGCAAQCEVERCAFGSGLEAAFS